MIDPHPTKIGNLTPDRYPIAVSQSYGKRHAKLSAQCIAIFNHPDSEESSRIIVESDEGPVADSVEAQENMAKFLDDHHVKTFLFLDENQEPCGVTIDRTTAKGPANS